MFIFLTRARLLRSSQVLLLIDNCIELLPGEMGHLRKLKGLNLYRNLLETFRARFSYE